jgi:hypothetical protein
MKQPRRILFLIFFSVVSFFPKMFSQTSITDAQAIFIYNFTRLIEWPAEVKTGDFIIGIYGSGDLFDQLKTYTNGKVVGTQPIKVVKFNYVTEITKCHILFVTFSKTKDMPTIAGVVSSNKTLIIAEKKGALNEGAAINFVIVEDKLKFEVKVSNATKNGLKVHSNLENMATAKY